MTDTDSSGLPQRDAGVACDNCGCEKRRPNSNRCAACGQFASDPRYAYSKLTNTWYRVTEYEELGDGKIRAKSKEEVDREKVPQEWIEAIDERSVEADAEDSITDGGHIICSYCQRPITTSDPAEYCGEPVHPDCYSDARDDDQEYSLDDGHHCCICGTDFDTIVELIRHDCDEHQSTPSSKQAADLGGGD